MLKDVHQAEIRDNKHCENIKVFVKPAGYYKYTFKTRFFLYCNGSMQFIQNASLKVKNILRTITAIISYGIYHKNVLTITLIT